MRGEGLGRENSKKKVAGLFSTLVRPALGTTKIAQMKLTAPTERNSKVNVIEVVCNDLQSAPSHSTAARSTHDIRGLGLVELFLEVRHR